MTTTCSVLAREPVLTAKDISKTFGGVHALTGVSLELYPGSVLALAGENGAGKSTLIKILTGIHQPDGGQIIIDGKTQHLTPARANELGIATVAQELSVLDHQSVADNISLGREIKNRIGLLDRRAQLNHANELLARLNMAISAEDMVRDLSLANKQMVEIAKAMSTNPRVLILDEPTSGLREDDVKTLLNLVRQLREAGTSIVIITHRMSEIFEVSDQVMILKDGQHISTVQTSQSSEEEIVRLMVGRELRSVFPPKPTSEEIGTELFAVRDFSVVGTPVHDINLAVRSGQIVALAGLAGQGQNSLLEGIAGLRKAHGNVTVLGKKTRSFPSVQRAAKSGVVLIPEDRKTQGLVLEMSVGENISLPTVHLRAVLGWVKASTENKVAEESIAKMEIRPDDPTIVARQLSGGNQQKVVIGKWLISEPKVVLCADPTRGIDVGTKQEIYALLRELAGRGVAILMLSTDLSEIIGLADVVHVMAEGRIVATLEGDEITEEKITAAAFQGMSQQQPTGGEK